VGQQFGCHGLSHDTLTTIYLTELVGNFIFEPDATGDSRHLQPDLMEVSLLAGVIVPPKRRWDKMCQNILRRDRRMDIVDCSAVTEVALYLFVFQICSLFRSIRFSGQPLLQPKKKVVSRFSLVHCARMSRGVQSSISNV